MQFFITGPILSRFGILIGLLVLPFFLIAGATSVLIAPILLSASIAKFSDQTFKFTINNSSMELLWLPVPPNIRKTIKPQVSGTVKSIAEGIGGLVTFLVVKIIALQYLSIISLCAIAVWILTAIKVKAGYVTQLQTAIAKRQIDFEDLTAIYESIETSFAEKEVADEAS